MSQTKFLETVVSWSTEECQKNLSFALPKLILSLQDDHNTKPKDVFNILLKQFAPLLTLQDSEEKLFLKIGNWLRDFFRLSFESIKQQLANNLIEKVKEVMQELCSIMDCLSVYIEKILAKQKDIHLVQISNLCSTSLNVIYICYQHCKESRDVYGRFLDSLNDTLNFLFSKTGVLLTKVNTLLHQVLIRSSNELHYLLTILKGLKEIGEIVFEIDIRMMAAVWKLYAKIAIEHEDLLKNDLEISPTLEILIEQLVNRLKTLAEIQKEDDKTLLKLIRMCGFILKIIVLLCDKYSGRLGDCQKSLLNLIIFLYSISPPSLDAVTLTDVLNHELSQQLTVGIEPLIVNLISDDDFRCTVLTECQEIERQESGFPYTRLLLSILEKLPTLKKRIFDHWLSQILNNTPSSILSAIFNTLPSSHVELTLPVNLHAISHGKGKKSISLYESICIRLCIFVSTLPARHFYYLENVLVTNLLSRHFWCRQMAMDVWSYLGRFESSDLCYYHFTILSTLVSHLHNNESKVTSHLVCLWNRLLYFLAREHLEKFTRKQSYLLVTKIGIKKNTPSNVIYLLKPLFEKSLSTLNVFLKSPLDVAETELISSFEVTYKILQAEPANLTADEIEKRYCLTDAVASLLRQKSLNSLLLYNNDTVMEQMIRLTSELIQNFSNEQLLQTLKSLEVIIKCVNSASRMYIANSLIKLHRFDLDPSLEKETLDKISYLFSVLLQDTNWIVLDRALETFTEFAHTTVHTSVIAKTASNNSYLQECMSSHINKVPWKYEGTNKDPVAFLKMEQLYMLKETSETITDDVKKSSQSTEHVTTTRKIEAALKAIQSNVFNLKVLLEDRPIPKWAKGELMEVQETLKSMTY